MCLWNTEFRISGLKVPVLSLGTNIWRHYEFFKRWCETGVDEASRLIDICLEMGLIFRYCKCRFTGCFRDVLGAALKGRRHQSLITTKATFSTGEGPNDKGYVAIPPDP
jgi:aryl-alcohol dehydrogenase-like predicted oxidoreductase